MFWKKAWRMIRITIIILYGLAMFALIGSLSFIIWLTIADKSAITNSNVVNSLSLAIGLVSMPGVLVSSLSIVEMNSKKKFKATMHCPNCKHNIDLKLVED